MTTNDFSGHEDRELLILYSELMRELRRRGVIRSLNNPVADVGESRASKALALTLVKRSSKGFDAEGADRTRYQIKARSRGAKGWRNLGGIRDIDERLFDRFAVVILDEVTFDVQLLFHFAYEMAVDYAKDTTRGFKRITITDAFLSDPRIVWVTGAPPSVERRSSPRRTLDDAIEIVLRETGPAGLTKRQIHHEIVDRRLYVQKDGKPVTRQHVNKRVATSERFVLDCSVYPRIVRLTEDKT